MRTFVDIPARLTHSDSLPVLCDPRIGLEHLEHLDVVRRLYKWKPILWIG